MVLCWVAAADLRSADSGQWNCGVAESAVNRPRKFACASLVGQSDGCIGQHLHQCFPATEEFVSTFGVIVGNRGFFPDVLARDGREEILRVLAEQGHKAFCLTPEESKFGSVETLADARRCADLFRSHGDEIDGVLVSLPNFGDERAIADTLRLARLSVPVLVQASGCAGEDDHCAPPRQFLRENVRMQQPEAIWNSLFPYEIAHRGPEFRGI